MRRKEKTIRATDPHKAIGFVRHFYQDKRVAVLSQRELIEYWCDREKITLVSFVEDAGGATDPLVDRSSLFQALAACELGGCGVLVAATWDRFARNKYAFADLERLADELVIQLVTVHGGLNENEQHRDIQQALACVGSQTQRAEMRREVTSKIKKQTPHARRLYERAKALKNSSSSAREVMKELNKLKKCYRGELPPHLHRFHGKAGTDLFAQYLLKMGFQPEVTVRCLKRNYRLDFLRQDLKLAVELDGPSHLVGSRVGLDKRRDRKVFQCSGITTLRFTDEDLIRDMRGCVAEVKACLVSFGVS